MDATAIIVACIGVVGIAVAGYFSWQAAKQSRTKNGSSQGELVELIADVVKDTKAEVQLIKLWVIEHTRAHEERNGR